MYNAIWELYFESSRCIKLHTNFIPASQLFNGVMLACHPKTTINLTMSTYRNVATVTFRWRAQKDRSRSHSYLPSMVLPVNIMAVTSRVT